MFKYRVDIQIVDLNHCLTKYLNIWLFDRASVLTATGRRRGDGSGVLNAKRFCPFNAISRGNAALMGFFLSYSRFLHCTYRLVQKKCPLFEFPSFLLTTNLGQPMHRQSALTKLSSLSFAWPCTLLAHSRPLIITELWHLAVRLTCCH